LSNGYEPVYLHPLFFMLKSNITNRKRKWPVLCSTLATIERVDLLHVMMDPEWISEPTDFPVCPPPSSPNPLIEHKHNRTNTPINRRRSQISSIPIAFVAFTRTERGSMEDPPLCTKQSGLQHSYIMTVNNRVTMRAVCCSVRVSSNLHHHL
jgi:hypothetical protein